MAMALAGVATAAASAAAPPHARRRLSQQGRALIGAVLTPTSFSLAEDGSVLFPV